MVMVVMVIVIVMMMVVVMVVILLFKTKLMWWVTPFHRRSKLVRWLCGRMRRKTGNGRRNFYGQHKRRINFFCFLRRSCFIWFVSFLRFSIAVWTGLGWSIFPKRVADGRWLIDFIRLERSARFGHIANWLNGWRKDEGFRFFFSESLKNKQWLCWLLNLLCFNLKPFSPSKHSPSRKRAFDCNWQSLCP